MCARNQVAQLRPRKRGHPLRMLPVHERVPDDTILPALDQNDLQVLNLAHIFGHVHRLRHRGIQQPGAGNRNSTLRWWQCNPPFGFQHPQRLHARCSRPRASKKPNCSHTKTPRADRLLSWCAATVADRVGNSGMGANDSPSKLPGLFSISQDTNALCNLNLT